MLQKSVVQWLGSLMLLFSLGFVSLAAMSCDPRGQTITGPVVREEVPAVERPAPAPLNATDRSQFAWPGPDWSSRVAWEARYALSSRADGTSNWKVGNDTYGERWIGDRCYTGNWNGEANDTYALERAKAESFGFVGTIGHQAGGSHHYSGWCTFFARFVLYRASYWAGYTWNGKTCHLTMPNFNGKDGSGSLYDWCNSTYMHQRYAEGRPGHLILSKQKPHVGILDLRATVNGRVGWWVIDGNYVGDWLIGRHFLPDSRLKSDAYWVWAPNLATTN